MTLTHMIDDMNSCSGCVQLCGPLDVAAGGGGVGDLLVRKMRFGGCQRESSILTPEGAMLEQLVPLR